ncbi:Chromosome partition protein Smc [Thalassoglobus neptunius]|uniref:Chromosome partition protein Smc n=1 Tax=Thalassoglobus neptunius TaxID=1938619 RepID=A0A5C5X987_9PLAN|nr:hypothetical protein [Thalassoglobus neptunius]TWT58873.1 Chromosome partition protein Smc [Thalassoglobus neptunius]
MSGVKREVDIVLKLSGDPGAPAAAKVVLEAVSKSQTEVERIHRESMNRMSALEKFAADERAKHWERSKHFSIESERAVVSQVETANKEIEKTSKETNKRIVENDKATMTERLSIWKSSQKEIDSMTSKLDAWNKQKTSENSMIGKMSSWSQAQSKAAAEAKAREEELARTVQRTSDQYVSAKERMHASQKALSDRTKGVLEGTMSLAQGFVTLGVVSQDNLEDVVRGLVKVQGAFSAFRGALTIFHELREGMKEWRKATVLATEANLALAASQKAIDAANGGSAAASVATTAASGAASSAAKKKAGSAVGTFVGGAVAGQVANSTLVASAGKGLMSLTGTLSVLGATGLVATEVLQGAARALGSTSSSSESLVMSIYSMREAQIAAVKSTESVTKAEANRQKLLDQQRTSNENIRKFENLRVQSQNAFGEVRSRVNALTGGDNPQEDRLRALSQLEQAEANLAAARERAIERQRAGQFALSADMEVAQERLKAATESRAAAEQRITDAARQRLEVQRQIVSAAKADLDAAEQRVQQEKQNQQSALARFAQLGKGDQAKLTEIAGRVKKGEDITKADADILNRTGFGKGLAEDFFAERGRDAGGVGILGALGESNGLDSAIEERDRLTRELNASQRKEATLNNDLLKAKQEYLNSLKALTEQQRQLLQSQVENQGLSPEDAANFENTIGRDVQNVGATIQRNMQQIDQDLQTMAANRAAQSGVI